MSSFHRKLDTLFAFAPAPYKGRGAPAQQGATSFRRLCATRLGASRTHKDLHFENRYFYCVFQNYFLILVLLFLQYKNLKILLMRRRLTYLSPFNSLYMPLLIHRFWIRLPCCVRRTRTLPRTVMEQGRFRCPACMRNTLHTLRCRWILTCPYPLLPDL